jgi:hypothetical protein
LVPAVHTGDPVAHEIVPRRHGLLGVQVIPATHPLHIPEPSHTPPGHAVPALRFVAKTHTAAPVVHEIMPVVQGLPVEHAMPAVHAAQLPLPSHTPPGHDAPAARDPLAMQTGAPLEQSRVPR